VKPIKSKHTSISSTVHAYYPWFGFKTSPKLEGFTWQWLLFACLLWAWPKDSNRTQNAGQSGAITETQECVTEVPRLKNREFGWV